MRKPLQVMEMIQEEETDGAATIFAVQELFKDGNSILSYPEKVPSEGGDHNSVIDLPRSDQFWNIHKGDEYDLNVFGLIGNEV